MLDVVTIANRSGATVVGSWELYDYFNAQGVKNVFPLNPGGKTNIDFGSVKRSLHNILPAFGMEVMPVWQVDLF